MNRANFIAAIREYFPVDRVVNNPGKGTSTIVSYSKHNLVYRRGNSGITVSLLNFHEAYMHFRGKCASSSDLREFNPSVFDSKASGHSCNCTTLFLILNQLNLCGAIEGRGVRGDPFRAQIFASPK